MALDKWEKKHVANIARYEKEIQQIYATAIAEAAQMASRVSFDPSKPFAFSDYPLTKALIDKLQKQVAADIEAVITKGVDTEFGLSQEKAEELAQSIYSDVENALLELRKQAYLRRRDNAREAFLMRKERGLSLSDRVWRYTGQFKEELEMALDLGLRDGLSADELSREVRKYLNNPNMLFRRVRDEHGVLHLSKRAKAYHPGQGVYRSSYKNARRLTATETNMAYRTADYNAYQALDFVVGIRIMLSNNHTLNGEPFFDICDNLSAPNGSTATKGKGCYPKDFKFTGWHPLCRCFIQTIHKTKEELREDRRRMRDGLPPLPAEQSANYVGDVPDEFKAWCRLNAGRVERAKSVPYFIRDNQEYYDAAFKKKALTPLELAEQRHAQRTPEHIESIKNRWHERQERYRRIELAANNVLKVAKDYGEVDYTLLQQYVDARDLKGMANATRTTAKDVLAMKQAENALADLIPNAHSLHRSTPMSELQQTYSELDGVMKNWLKKYGYSSLDNAPLDHLRNKLDFELNSTRKYTHSDIVKEALTDKIKLVDRKIEWNSLISRVDSLKSFKTRSSTYKGYLADIDGAIKRNDFAALQNSIAQAEAQQQKLTQSRIKRSGDTTSALNKEYKGSVVGADITSSVDATKMISEDPYSGTFTNNVARMQGYDSPAKLVTEAEFDMLQKANGDIFFRTVNPTKFRGKDMTSEEFASQLYKADLLELNGPGGRVHGDGMYVATSAWNGRTLSTTVSADAKKRAYRSSIGYGNGNHTITEMTWIRKPKIILKSDLYRMWDRLTPQQQRKYGGTSRFFANTYGCALGYDAMYCDGVDYMVIWNRSIIAVKKR